MEPFSEVLRRSAADNPYILNPSFAKRNVLSILDEFSQSCFADLFNLFPAGLEVPGVDFLEIAPDFVLVESAWQGNEGAWRYRISRKSVELPDLERFIRDCRNRNIPTVFWNKEDPVHFDDFKNAARLFDFILTTDGGAIKKYTEIAGHKNVELMRFFASPSLHNPQRVEGFRQGDVAFAGQYFRKKFPERRAQMEILFAAAAKHRFSIFSRVLGGPIEYQFPPEYARFVVGSLPYNEMINEYKRHKIFLNVNSVTHSTTMSARRVFELAACKTVVMTMPNPALDSVFGSEELLYVDSVGAAEMEMDRILGDEVTAETIGHRAWRRVAGEHLGHHRAQQILSLIGLEDESQKIHIDIFVTSSDLEDLLARAVHQLSQQTLCHERGVHLRILDPMGNKTNFGEVYECNEILPDYVTVMNLDHEYGKHYLRDQFMSLRYFSSEAIVSKPVEISDIESVVGRIPAFAWMGVYSKETTELVRRVLSEPRRVISAISYSTDRFNYLNPDRPPLWFAQREGWEI